MLKLEGHIKHITNAIENSSDPGEKRDILISAVKELPKTSESLPLFHLYFDLLNKIEHADEKRACILEFLKEIPQTDGFRPLYLKAIESAIDAISKIEDRKRRRLELFHILNELPKTEEFIKPRIHALRLAMGLLDKPEQRKTLLSEIARELPKSSDDSFYRRYTLLGIVNELPKTGAFLSLYKEAIGLAIEAAGNIEEPYYREYALIHIARELPKTEEYLPLYKLAISAVLNAATAIKDPLARKYALLDILKDLPKTSDFFNIFHEIIKQTLSLYSVKHRLDNIDVVGRIDYFLAGEQKRMTESKKAKYAKIKFAQALARELDEFGLELNDIRFIETLKPYTHAWIQPIELRSTVKKMIDRLENLRNSYHGKEIKQPVFIKEYHRLSQNQYIHKSENTQPKTCLSIDLGATNTIVMMRHGLGQPDFISLGPISKLYGKTYVIPTLLNPETNSIGSEAVGKDTVVNIKKMLMDGSPNSNEYMERYIRILYQYIKKATIGTSGRFSLFSRNVADAVYITVPVGFHNYRKDMKEILERIIKGVAIVFLEEPLASAIGYQVADEQDKIIMLIDFGGCTLNTMALRLNINETHVVAKPDRAKMLGGRDIDIWIADYMAKKIDMAEENIPQQLILKAEEIKIALSEQRVAPFEWNGVKICKVSREDFEDILSQHDFYKIIDRTLSNILKKAEKIGIRKDMIDAILLTGGSSQIPSFKEKIAHIFPMLAEKNAIYDHDPLSAAARGAALYDTRNIIIDRHLAFGYAIRYTTKNKDALYLYKLILEKGDSLPIEKTFKLIPAMTLGPQEEIYLELFEVPENLIERRWVTESGIEFIKQEIKQVGDMALKDLKIITLSFKEPITEDVYAAFCVDETGHLMVKYGKEATGLETGIRLQ
ncbi:MAG: Hsp70 family protein [Deltaproteobacteria bacterium]|nr:Hsp70 family protein [Deltaproteobacteria bacterium]